MLEGVGKYFPHSPHYLVCQIRTNANPATAKPIICQQLDNTVLMDNTVLIRFNIFTVGYGIALPRWRLRTHRISESVL